MTAENCKRCLLREMGESDQSTQIQKAILRLKPHEKVSQNEYEKRLLFCKECEHLISGCCVKCGCYVELRAMLKSGRCPLSKDKRKW